MAHTHLSRSWRSEGIKHKKNEIFLDVANDPDSVESMGCSVWPKRSEVERLNLLVSANGSVLRSEILGALKMKLTTQRVHHDGSAVAMVAAMGL